MAGASKTAWSGKSINEQNIQMKIESEHVVKCTKCLATLYVHAMGHNKTMSTWKKTNYAYMSWYKWFSAPKYVYEHYKVLQITKLYGVHRNPAYSVKRSNLQNLPISDRLTVSNFNIPRTSFTSRFYTTLQLYEGEEICIYSFTWFSIFNVFIHV